MRFLVLGLLFVAGAAGATLRRPLPLPCSELPGTAADAQFTYHPYNGQFVFARIYYDPGMRGFRGWGPIGASNGPPWSHDFPDAEQNVTKILRELTYARAFTESGNILALDNPRLTCFPIAYMSEPGYWSPNEKEVAALRNYLLKGGFIIFDDFGGSARSRQMENLAAQMRRAFPDLQFMPLDAEDAVFDSFFRIDPRTLDLIMPYMGRRTEWWGLFLDNDKSKRMIAVAGNYGDLGEFWEYSATGMFPVDLSNDAYKVGINYIIHGMTR